MMVVSPNPPRRLSEKSIVFLKCSHASKLSRESIGNDVVYSECSNLPLGKLFTEALFLLLKWCVWF